MVNYLSPTKEMLMKKKKLKAKLVDTKKKLQKTKRKLKKISARLAEAVTSEAPSTNGKRAASVPPIPI